MANRRLFDIDLPRTAKRSDKCFGVSPLVIAPEWSNQNLSETPNTAILLAGRVATFSGVSIANSPKAVLPIVNRPLYGFLAAVLGASGSTD